MKLLKLLVVLFFTTSLNLYAYDLSGLQNKSLICEVNQTLKIPLPKKRKHSETRYEKLERKLSEYRGTWFNDMMLYSVDIFIPDEMMRAVKDVMQNREKVRFGNQVEKVPKTLMNDSYNVALTTAYYYMQDIARISERLWKNKACTPDHFEYDIAKEPAAPFLDLSECDPMSIGVTKNGIVLPKNENFPSALYPYASKPDGCSAEGLQDLYDQSNDILNNAKWLKKVCNRHDQCYYTEGTTIKESIP
ncbi:MAG: hypothetical protein Q9M39_05015 [Sulfurovum sp.]|nr:hypothetical protein [Sulfurovum sp.]